jgi:hypothetical protein
MPYVQSGQVSGIVIGLRGGAELEQLTKMPGIAAAGMDAQSLGHFAILAFMLLGNLAYMAERRKKGAARRREASAEHGKDSAATQAAKRGERS